MAPPAVRARMREGEGACIRITYHVWPRPYNSMMMTRRGSEQTVRRVLHDRDRRSCTRCASACLCASFVWLPRSRYVLPCEYVRFFRTVTSAHDAGKHASSCRERERVVVDQWGSTTQSTRPTSPCSRTWRSSTTRDSGRGTGRRPLKLRGGRRRALVALHQDIATHLASGLSLLPGVRCGGTSSLSEWVQPHRCASDNRTPPSHRCYALATLGRLTASRLLTARGINVHWTLSGRLRTTGRTLAHPSAW